jgi:hypothetical protein
VGNAPKLMRLTRKKPGKRAPWFLMVDYGTGWNYLSSLYRYRSNWEFEDRGSDSRYRLHRDGDTVTVTHIGKPHRRDRSASPW